ncbi:hypothetical protein [Janthinobacterium sp. PC23-8]|uniref:hypothetical protein n=1 Tax=Janthinobacterium sp. PC23-8 TaxID=2012679 RepID=UPI000B97A436|nr:hypothetical protein [Janthinobacterium sp. PC23-8]OYO29209.1 hypothetical protein CD932_19135 [Janthinobacterium sp. PC23-8]
MLSNLPSTAQALVPYTGYYPLPNVAGAFITVDTSMTSAGGSVSYDASVTISTDGLNSTQYPASACALDSNTLVITGQTGTVASLDFTPTTGGMQVRGTITGYAGQAQGVSPFAPVNFAVWDGIYYAQLPSLMVQGVPTPFSFVPALEVKVDAQGNQTVWWASSGAPLQQVAWFRYDFAMFVIAFALAEGAEMMFEMGTAAGWGKVAGNAKSGYMLVSIQQQVPVPNL